MTFPGSLLSIATILSLATCLLVGCGEDERIPRRLAEDVYPVERVLPIDGEERNVIIVGRDRNSLLLRHTLDGETFQLAAHTLPPEHTPFVKNLPYGDMRAIDAVREINASLVEMRAAPDSAFGPPPVRENTLAGLEADLRQAQKVLQASSDGDPREMIDRMDYRSVAATYPFKRQITNTEGKKIDSIILGRSESEILLRKFGDSRQFRFPLDKLTAKDRLYFRTLALGTIEEIEGIKAEIAKVEGYIETEQRQLEGALTNPRRTNSIHERIANLKETKRDLEDKLRESIEGRE